MLAGETIRYDRIQDTQRSWLSAALEAQPRVVREALMRRFAEAWLERQRRKYRSGRDPGSRA